MMEFGRRLLPQVVDHYARTEPDRVYASIPKSATDLADGFQDVTMAKLAAVVNRLSWWLRDVLGEGHLEAIAYVGPADIRYAAIFLAAVKCRYKMLFISPRNHTLQNKGMLERSGCRALFYADEMVAMAEEIRGSPPQILVKAVPSLDELLPTPEDTNHYPYERTFDEAQNEPCLILHSSGSTGDPKLVTMTHGTFSVTDNDRNMPVPEGRLAQNAGRFNFEGGGKFYSCFPPYHLAGVHAYIDLPIFSTSATVVFGPTGLPPSGYLLSEILKYQHVRAFYVPPFIIEQWSTEPVATEQSKQLDFVLYGGGPLSPHIGDRLSQTTHVCQMYGSLEIGQVQLLVPRPGEWSYMELNPFEEADMQPFGDGTFEMVLHQDPKFATRRSLWHNFPDVNEWRTGDLFVPHPSKPWLWRFHSRVDDLIVFSSSHKLRPLEMETIIQGYPLLSGALIVGQGKPEPLLIVETKPGAYDGNNPQAIIDRIWPTIEEANNIAPSYGTIRRSRVLVADPEKSFVRAPKGSVVRKLTTKAYAQEIEAAYDDSGSTRIKSNGIAADDISSFLLPGLKQFVRKHVEDRLPGVPLSDSDNLFVRGLDSLGAAGLSRGLQQGLATQVHSTRGSFMPLRAIYMNPTIEGLANVALNLITNREVPGFSIVNDVKGMERALEELTRELPPKTVQDDSTEESTFERLNVALVGPRGSLGPKIVKELMADPRVAKIYCLNRGQNGREKMDAIFANQSLPCDVHDERLSFMSVDLGKPKLGLSDADYDELLQSVNVIIHNAWKVDFSWTLDSYKVEHLRSVRELVDFSSSSPLKPRIVFISSISSVQEWAAIYSTPVTETPLESYNVASPLGYGQSKHVSERVLVEASAVSGTPVTILRVGQVAGPTNPSGAKWSTDEWIPSVAAISKTLKLVPSDIPPIDWVPVDLAARAIVELLLPQAYHNGHAVKPGLDSLEIFNVVNPKLSEWATFANALQRRLGPEARQVTLTKWVEALVRTDPKTLSEKEAASSTKILPFFQHLAETAARGIALQPKFETAKAVEASKTMADMRPIEEDLVNLWFQQWGI